MINFYCLVRGHSFKSYLTVLSGTTIGLAEGCSRCSVLINHCHTGEISLEPLFTKGIPIVISIEGLSPFNEDAIPRFLADLYLIGRRAGVRTFLDIDQLSVTISRGMKDD